jgi:hypothetical protein
LADTNLILRQQIEKGTSIQEYKANLKQ